MLLGKKSLSISHQLVLTEKTPQYCHKSFHVSGASFWKSKFSVPSDVSSHLPGFSVRQWLATHLFVSFTQIPLRYWSTKIKARRSARIAGFRLRKLIRPQNCQVNDCQDNTGRKETNRTNGWPKSSIAMSSAGNAGVKLTWSGGDCGVLESCKDAQRCANVPAIGRVSIWVWIGTEAE